MAEEADNTRDATYWERRMEQVTQENIRLFEFVHLGVETGRVSEEASKAFFDASVRAMHRAGIVGPAIQREPQLQKGGSDRPLACTVLEQALHEARQALLRIQPELKDALDREAPASKRDGRSP